MDLRASGSRPFPVTTRSRPAPSAGSVKNSAYPSRRAAEERPPRRGTDKGGVRSSLPKTAGPPLEASRSGIATPFRRTRERCRRSSPFGTLPLARDEPSISADAIERVRLGISGDRAVLSGVLLWSSGAHPDAIGVCPGLRGKHGVTEVRLCPGCLCSHDVRPRGSSRSLPRESDDAAGPCAARRELTRADARIHEPEARPAGARSATLASPRDRSMPAHASFRRGASASSSVMLVWVRPARRGQLSQQFVGRVSTMNRLVPTRCSPMMAKPACWRALNDRPFQSRTTARRTEPFSTPRASRDSSTAGSSQRLSPRPTCSGASPIPMSSTPATPGRPATRASGPTQT